MSNSKYYNTNAAMQIIGCIINKPSILNDEGRYFFNEQDFQSEFHKIIFGSIYNLYQMGAQQIGIVEIEEYLSNRPQALATYKTFDGAKWLIECAASAELENFDYNYNRLKKMTLLRSYEDFGLDVKFLYDPDTLDIKKKKAQEDYIDKISLNELADIIENKILLIRSSCVDNSVEDAVSIGDNILTLIDELKQEPDMGPPMYGSYINTVLRGMRERKFYLRSAATGIGKSRSMIADACYTACSSMYKDDVEQWIDLGLSLPTLFISTELELMEVQTMALAFISNVSEDHILTGEYDFGEEERVRQAAIILSQAPLYIEELPDFSLRDIENTIKRNIRVHSCKYVFLDYIHTSMKILEEISQRSGGVRLREDNILFLLSVKLKDIANEFGVFILSSTQLNKDWANSDTPDQNLLRGQHLGLNMSYPV